MRLNEDVLAIGFDNGAFVKIVEPGCFEERGLTQETCVLSTNEAPKEVRIYLNALLVVNYWDHTYRGKLIVALKVISKDLEVLFLAAPVFRDGSFFATREVYKNRMRRRKKKKNREEEGASKKTLIRKGFLNNT